MRRTNVELEIVHQPGDEGKLLRRADRTTHADRIVRGRLPPRGHILQRLGQIEVFQAVIEDDLKTGPRKPLHRFRRQLRHRVDQFLVQGRVIPPPRGY